MTQPTPRIRRPARDYGVLIALVLSAVFICVVSAGLVLSSLQGDRQEAFTDLEGVTVQALVELEGERAYPKSLVIGADGYIYSGSHCTGEIWRISPGGDLEIWLPAGSGIQAVSGMAFAPDDTLYVVDSRNCDPRKAVSELKRVLPDKTVESWGEVTEDELLNRLTFDSQGILYATDTQLGQIRAFDAEGAVTIWWEMPNTNNDPLPTGIEYDPFAHAIVAADSKNGLIYRVPIEETGAAGAAEILYEDANHTLDGLTLDDQGRIIFTSYDNDSVLRLESDGSTTRLATRFRDPSDVAYLEGRVYVTNFDAISLAPIVSLIYDPLLPFSIDVIDLRAEGTTPE